MAECRIDITKAVERATEQLKAAGWRPEIISKFVPFDESDYIKIMRKAAINGLPLFKGTCSRCRGNCFDDDIYCATCGAKLFKEAEK